MKIIKKKRISRNNDSKQLMLPKKQNKKLIEVDFRAIVSVLAIWLVMSVLIIIGYNRRVRYFENEIDNLINEKVTLREQVSECEETIYSLREKNDLLSIDLKAAENDVSDLIGDVAGMSEAIKTLEEENKFLSEISEYVYNGSWNYDYTEDDVRILAGVMYGENYISGRWEMMLTGSVVLNRIISDKFPNTVSDVVYQFDGGYEQYAPRTKRLIGSSEVTPECYDLARLLLKYGPVAPPFVLYQAHFNQGNVYWEWKGEEFCYK